LGTRLRPALGALPKPLAPIDGRPFLAWLLDLLAAEGVTRFILSVGYGAERIESEIGARYRETEVVYVREQEPLGTGGATRVALAAATHDPVWILNGDTYVELDLEAAREAHQERGVRLSMGIRWCEDCARFGRVEVEQGIARRFEEKGRSIPGWINAGIYLMNRSLLSAYSLPERFSLETDWLVPHCSSIEPRVMEATGYFVDIGVPESYREACRELPARVGAHRGEAGRADPCAPSTCQDVAEHRDSRR
jgi:D-glycero-alpha-D-manno-heptose 1-phosphate guanylyltransferase